MSLPVILTTKDTKEKKRIKTKIGVGYSVKEKVGDMENKTREARTMRTRKEVVGCVQDLVRKKNL